MYFPPHASHNYFGSDGEGTIESDDADKSPVGRGGDVKPVVMICSRSRGPGQVVSSTLLARPEKDTHTGLEQRCALQILQGRGGATRP